MRQPTISVEGRRVYIEVEYGDPVVRKLKNLKAHWEPSTKRWWVGTGKKAEVERIVAKASARPQGEAIDDPGKIKVSGRATYKGRTYYVRWVGRTRTGEHKVRLCSLDGKIDFWVPTSEDSPTGATLGTPYGKPRSLASIQKFVAEKKAEKEAGKEPGKGAEPSQSGPGPRPSDDCYLGPGGEWIVRGCGECRRLGRLCDQCRHDIYDC